MKRNGVVTEVDEWMNDRWNEYSLISMSLFTPPPPPSMNLFIHLPSEQVSNSSWSILPFLPLLIAISVILGTHLHLSEVTQTMAREDFEATIVNWETWHLSKNLSARIQAVIEPVLKLAAPDSKAKRSHLSKNVILTALFGATLWFIWILRLGCSL